VRIRAWLAALVLVAGLDSASHVALTQQSMNACTRIRQRWRAMTIEERRACFAADVSDNADGVLVASLLEWFAPYLDADAPDSQRIEWWAADWLSPLVRYQIFTPPMGFLAFRWRLTLDGWKVDRIIGYA
jgi:hypothetical protein